MVQSSSPIACPANDFKNLIAAPIPCGFLPQGLTPSERSNGMITVTIAINNRVIYARSAVNTDRKNGTETIYAVDDGSEIRHNRKYGAVKLAMKMLLTLEEFGVEK